MFKPTCCRIGTRTADTKWLPSCPDTALLHRSYIIYMDHKIANYNENRGAQIVRGLGIFSNVCSLSI